MALAAVFLLGVACQPGNDGGASAPDGPATASGEVAARIDGVAITTDEIDARAREELFNARAGTPSKLYELRSQTLQAMLNERVVEVIAENRGTTPEALIAAELEAMGPVGEEEAQAFYTASEARLGQATFEEVKGQILDFLASRREASVEILLEPPRIEVAAIGPSRGADGAKVTIVEFSDFQCPYCQRVIPTLAAIEERYPNDVRIVFRNFPLGNHSRATPAAEAALCADDQGKFWPYHDVLFENARALEDEQLVSYAEQVGLDKAAFEACIDEGRFSDQVARDIEEGRAAGVTGTPAFFVNGVMLSGARPKEAFFELIDTELARN